MQLEKILEEIDQKIAKVRSIPISEDEFAADGEEIYYNGKTQGRYEELIWCRNIILKHINDGWIPVEELPPEDDREYCTRYQIMTKYGVTEGWYQPDGNVWYVLLWRHLCENGEIDFEKGDIPTLELIDPEIRTDIISAWRPLPDPYCPERSTE